MNLRTLLLLSGLGLGTAFSQTTVNFASLPNTYFFNSGGQNIGSYYSGVTFGPTVTALSVSRFGGYNSAGYPPHSGDVTIWDAYDPTITITFASPVQSFGIWYASLGPLQASAYDVNNTFVGNFIGGAANTDGVKGTTSALEVNGPGIKTVKITGLAGLFTLSSLTYVPASAYSTFPVLNVTVSPASPSRFGQPLALTATEYANNATLGLVEFYDGGTLLGITHMGSVTGTLSHVFLSPGAHALWARTAFSSPATSPKILQEVTPVSGSVPQLTATVNTGNTSAAPNSVAVADVNNDGIADLVVADYGYPNPGDVRVFLGKGDGTFQAAKAFQAGTTPYAIAIGDFNLDGNPDLAVTNYLDHDVSILLGNGDGTFRAAVNYNTGTNPAGVVIGDFNGDGFPDLAVASVDAQGNNVSILLGNTNTSGTFQPAIGYGANAGNPYPSAVAAGDFNGDGKTDLAVLDLNTGHVGVLLGNGNGTFPNEVNYTVGGVSRGLAVADVNNDGIPDLVVASETGPANSPAANTVCVLLGQGGGTFLPAVQYAGGAALSNVAVADIDGDGALDIAVTSKSARTVNVLYGTGTGTFQSPASYSVGASPTAVLVADFNNDGRADLAVAANNISILSGASPPAMGAALTPSSGSGASQIFAASYSDPAGFQDITQAFFMVATDPGGVSGCVVLWDRASGNFFLANNPNTAWMGPLQSGGATLENSQCVLHGVTSSASGMGNALNIDFGLTFKSGFTGAKNTYLRVYGSNANSPWQAEGTWTVLVPVLTVTKSHTGNFVQGQKGAAYRVRASNAAGAGPTNGTVTVTETVPTGMTLVSMAGTGWVCPSGTATCTRSDVLTGGANYPEITVTVNVAANAPTQVTNQVVVSGGGSASVSASDLTNVNTVSICTVTASPASPVVAATAGTLTLTFNGGLCGWTAQSNVAWLTPAATSGSSTSLNVTVAANAAGAQRTGNITINGQSVTVTQAASTFTQAPALVSLSPFQGTGPNATLTLVYSDANGWAAIKSAEFIMNPRWEPAARGGGCYVKYAPGTGLFTLIADDGTSVAGSTAPGTGSNIFNNQCTLNAANSSVTGSGNTLTVVASLAFTPSFSGMRHIWMQAVDTNNLSSNWLVYGAWFPTQTTVNTFTFYRIYDPNSKSYLNGDLNEYTYLGTQGFTQLGPAGLIMDSPGSVGGVSNIAWYRLYVNANASHFYTSDRNEFLYWNNQPQVMVGEGVSGFMVPYLKADGTYNLTPPTNMLAFYRAGQGTDLHYWTADPDEFFGRNGKHLPPGYNGEGIASWVFPASGAVFNNSAGMTESPAPVDPDDGGPAVVGALNAASRASSGVIAPGQVLSVVGRHLGGRVLLNGVAAQVISAADNEIRIVVPKDLTGEVSLQVEHRGRRTKAAKLDVVPANPAIFGSNAYGRGNAQARNADGAMNGTENAALRGSVVTLYTTGIGSLDLPVEVHIGGYPAEVLATRELATRAGVIEVQVRVPETVAAGAFQPVVLHVGNLFSQPGVGLAIR